jgi:hypothetical protein
LRVLDDQHLIFADVASPRTIANLNENPQIAIFCLDIATKKGCRIWGNGEVIESGTLFNEIVDELANRNLNMKVNNVVRVTVDELEIF